MNLAIEKGDFPLLLLTNLELDFKKRCNSNLIP